MIVDGSGETGEGGGWGDEIAGQEVGDTPGVRVAMAAETRMVWKSVVMEIHTLIHIQELLIAHNTQHTSHRIPFAT